MAELLRLTEFGGQDTNSAAGTVPAPSLLLNVNLDRTGGWSAMSARSRQLDGVIEAISAGTGADLFVRTAAGVGYWNAFTRTLTPLSVETLGTVLMPGLMLDMDGVQVLASGTVPAPASPAGKITPSITYNPDTPSLGNSLDPDIAYEVAIVVRPAPGSAYQGVLTFSDPGSSATSPYWLQFTWDSGQPPVMQAYIRFPADPRHQYDTFKFLGSNVDAVGKLRQAILVKRLTSAEGADRTWDVAVGDVDEIDFTLPTYTQAPATYHKGRVFLSPVGASYDVLDGKTAITPTEDSLPNRVYFSQVIGSASLTSVPAFSLVNYFDVPFRVSRSVVAMQSVGNYLYLWGERELWVMTGDPSADANLECIADSIGAVSALTVQQLGGTVYWLSDSGVLAVQGAQVREVSGPIRDQLAAFIPDGSAFNTNITSTVDFAREQYILSNRSTLLVYHARENGWTTRQVEGTSLSDLPDLLYGGGTPYLTQGGTLYSIGGETGLDGVPARLPMRVQFPAYELGTWDKRKEMTGLMFGLDLGSGAATVTNTSTVDTQAAQNSVTVYAEQGPAVRLHLSDQYGTQLSGVSLAVGFTVSTQDARGIIRPPLVVTGQITGDVMWGDNAG